MAQRFGSAGALAAIVLLAGGAVAQEAPPSRSVWIIPKLGFVSGGGGSYGPKCSGPGCVAPSQPTTNFDDDSSFGVGADVLATLTPNLRLGGGMMVDRGSKVTASGFSESLGTELSWNGVVEGVLPVSRVVSLVAHGQLGVLFLFAGDDLKNTVDATRRGCSNACDVDGGPYKTFTFGFGGALVARVSSRVALRGDLMLQEYTAMNLVTVKSGGTEQSTSISGHRVWVMAGFEIGF